MRAQIRCDASPALGAGHWSRCLALARALARDGAEVGFICRAEAGAFAPVMAAAGLPIDWLTADTPGTESADAAACRALLACPADRPLDWLILDHHGLGQLWERALRPCTRRILVIDDGASRPHDCDCLLNPNLPVALEAYRERVPPHCRLLLGPRHALLGPEFLRLTPRARDGRARRLLISFGGSDPPGASLLAMTALHRLAATGHLTALDRIELIAGGANPHWASLRESALPGVRLIRRVRDMAARIQAADLILGAGGGSLWERCWLGAPALVIALVPPQQPVAEAVAAAGAIRYLGPITTVNAGSLSDAILAALHDHDALRAMGERARALTGGAEFIHSPRAFLRD